MAFSYGELLRLKIGDGAVSGEVFSELGGLKATNFTLKNSIHENNSPAAGEWRSLKQSTGKRSVSVSASGNFENKESDEALRALAFANLKRNFRIELANGDSLTGAFLVTSYQRNGNESDEEGYSISLESAGELVYGSAG